MSMMLYVKMAASPHVNDKQVDTAQTNLLLLYHLLLKGGLPKYTLFHFFCTHIVTCIDVTMVTA